MRFFFLIAFRNIIQSRVRSGMLGVAILVVTVIFSLLLALVSGVQLAMIQNGTALMTGHLNIAGFYKISQSSANPSVTKYQPLMEYAKKLPEASIVLDRVKAYGKVISDTESVMIPMWGVNMDQEENVLGRLEVEKGDIFQLKKRGTFALFATHAKKLNIDVNDMVTLSLPTYRNMNNTMDLKVVAILKDLGLMSQFSAYMTAADAREIYQAKADSTGQIMIYLKKRGDLPAVESRMRNDIAQMGYQLMDKDVNPFWMKFDRVSGESWTGQKIDVTTWEDETSFLKWIVGILSALSFVLIGILSVIIVTGIINSMWMAVKERTTEIGTLRAIGMHRSRVLLMFVLESLILSVSATTLGMLIAGFLCGFLNWLKIPIESDAAKMFLMTNHLSFQFGMTQMMIAFFSLVGFFTLGALIPAYQATKLSPLEAINQS